MVSAATAGFRGPAKRAAFGDVTNMPRHTAAHDDAKAGLKVQPVVASTHGPIGSKLNKENTTYSKDSLSRAALRPGALGNKIIKPLSESQSIQAPKPPLHQQRPLAPQDSNAATNLPPSRLSKESHDQVSALLQRTTSHPAKQPRHHKSQPQLKAQQPSLRRTQSKFFEKIDYESTHLDIPEEPELAELHVPALEQASGHTVYFDTGPYHIDSESQQPPYAAEAMPLTANATAAEIRPTTSHSYKESSYPALSEPEEWDEEEDEEYDDQDQAYTTAHSFRSRDCNTIGATTLVAPRITARIQRELEEARIEVEESRFADEFEEEAWDVTMVAEYGDEIFDYLRELEASRRYHWTHMLTTGANRLADQDAPQPPLHGDADRDSMVHAIGPDGLAGASSQPLCSPPRDVVSHCQLHRPLPVLQDHLGHETTARWRDGLARCIQVRGNQLPVDG